MRVLGIDVGDDLIARWRGWLMPQRQPYVVPRDVAATGGFEDDPARLSMEVKNSLPRTSPVSLPSSRRVAAQAGTTR